MAIEGYSAENLDVEEELKNDISQFKGELDEASDDVLINNLKLKEFNDPNLNRSYYGLPNGVKLYKRENNDNFYYYIDGSSVVAIPNFLKLRNEGKTCREWPTKEVFKNGKREKSYNLEDTQNINEWLNYSLLKELSSSELSPLGKRIYFDKSNNKYVLLSYGQKTYIENNYLKSGCIFKDKKDFPRELKIFNLKNYIFNVSTKNTLDRKLKDKETFFLRNGELYGTHGTRYLSSEGFKKYYNLTDKEKMILCNFLNNEVPDIDEIKN